MWGLLLYTIFNNDVIYLEFNSQHGSQIGIIANIIADALNFETWFLCYSERYTVYTFYIFPAISRQTAMISAGLLFTVQRDSTRIQTFIQHFDL